MRSLSCSLLTRKASVMPDAAAMDLSWQFVTQAQFSKQIHSNTHTSDYYNCPLNLISRGNSLSDWLGLYVQERIASWSPAGIAGER